MIQDHEIERIRHFLTDEFDVYRAYHQRSDGGYPTIRQAFMEKYNVGYNLFWVMRCFQNEAGETLEEQGYRKRTLFLVEEFDGAENQDGDKFRLLCAYVGGIKKKKHDSAYRLTYNFMWEDDRFSLKGEHSINPLKVEYHASGIHLVSLVNYTDRKKMTRPSIGELHQRHYDRSLALTLMDDD